MIMTKWKGYTIYRMETFYQKQTNLDKLMMNKKLN